MPTYSPTDGVNETEPTLIGDGAFQDCQGAEYRVGQPGAYVARGRQKVGSLGVTGKGVYEAGFDGTAGFVIAHGGDNLYAAPIAASLAFTTIDTLATGSSAVVGAHYASRHYVATGVGNRRLEYNGTGGVTSLPIGMSQSTFGIATVAGGTGSMTATTGLVYWTTEYDSVRGNESITGSSVNTGPFTNVAQITAVVTGVSANRTANRIRWYRSVDGGGYPDGGMVGETAIGTTSLVDTLTTTSTLSVPEYGVVSIGGVDNDRDAAPPVFSTIFGPFQDSLLAVDPTEPRNLRFTPAGYPDSWPALYGIPLETKRNDEIVTGVVLPSRIGVFCKDSVHVIYRLPRDSDSVFAAGEMQEPVTLARGCVSRRGATDFTPSGSTPLAAFVSRDGIWATTLTSSPFPLTDRVNWKNHVSVPDLSECRLYDDPDNRRLVFIFRQLTDTTYNTGLWYLDYQEFIRGGVRILFANHGPLVDAQTIAAPDGLRQAASLDARANNGQVYLESVQDVDDSHLLDSSGSVAFKIRTKEYMSAGASGVFSPGKFTWMHDGGPAKIESRFYFDRRDSNPEMKPLENATVRQADDVQLIRSINSMSVELYSVGTVSYGVHWWAFEFTDAAKKLGRGGA